MDCNGVGYKVDQKLAHLHLRAFGQRIREMRRKARLSQEELAMLAQLDRSYVGGVERGERNISLINIYKLQMPSGFVQGYYFNEPTKVTRTWLVWNADRRNVGSHPGGSN
jgi:DNA-binding XRE family transcriptional regulator